MSGSEYDATLNFGLKKPWNNQDSDVWGDHWNQNADAIDNLFLTLSNKAVVGPSPTSGGRGELWWDSVSGQLYVEYDDGDSTQFVSANSAIGLPLTGGAMSGPLLLHGNATQPLEAVPLQQLNAATAGAPFLPLTGGTVTGMLTASAGFTASAGANFYVGNPAVNGFTFNQNVYGATGPGEAAWFVCNVNADTADATAAGGGGATCSLFGLNISPGAVGGRNGMYVALSQVGATTMTQSQYYVCHAAFAEMGFSAGGTSGSRIGTLFGRNTSARVKTGAGLYQLAVCGDEIDVSVQAGTAVAWKAGLNIVQWADDAVRGSQMDAAFGINNQAGGTAPGWKIGINFGGLTGWWPFRNDSTIMGTTAVAAGGPAVAANWGIDFSAIAFTGGFLRSTGFSVDGTGKTTIAGITANGGILFNSAAVATPTDLSKHISLANDGSFGVNCSNEGPGGNLNLVLWAGGAQRWMIGGTATGYVNASGLNGMPIGAQAASTAQLSGLGLFGHAVQTTRPTVTGAKGSNAALASLLTALAAFGLVTDSSTA